MEKLSNIKPFYCKVLFGLAVVFLTNVAWAQVQNESEPNNEIGQANKLNLNQEMIGHGYPLDDRDWYVITIPEPGMDILIIELSAVPEVNLLLEFLDADGKELKEADNGEEGEEEIIIRMKVKPGKYYISVLAYYGSNEEVTYTLSAKQSTRPPATEEEVSQALTKALDYLARKQSSEGQWMGEYEGSPGIAGLALMAFLGGGCVPKDYSSQINATIDFLKSKYHPSSSYKPGSEDALLFGGLISNGDPMYEHSIATLALIEALVELNEHSLELIIEDALKMIVRTQNSEHKPESLGGPINPDSDEYGGWRYRPDSTDSDISVTGWQILALKAALNAGFPLPDWTLPTAAKFLRACYDEDTRAFAYEAGSGSIGCARTGIGVLGLQLTGYPGDPLIPPATRFMQDNPPVWNFEDPGEGWPFYYWYYGTRAMLISGGDDWRIWKAWMCRLLVDNQNDDGSWDGAQKEEDMDVYTTSLGALMLEFCCGHVPVYMRKKVALPGWIQVEFEKGEEKEATKNVEIILDASNSMWGQIEGVAKIAIAKNVLEQIITGLPDEMHVGLRLYGHRYGLNDQRACQDTELNVPIGPIDKTRLIDIIQNIQPKGKTPLVYSVLQAGNDFQNIQSGSIILITDGVESCEGEINSIAPALKELGIELKLHIVGFDIKEAEARAELEAIAKSTEGIYLDAKDSQELLSSLEQTLQIEFEILDEKGKRIAKGLVGGEATRIMEGSYTLRLLVDPEPFETAITVKPRQKSTLILTKEQDKWVIKN